ncbi:hypothetical protein D3C72_2072780 [compost metagenome]
MAGASAQNSPSWARKPATASDSVIRVMPRYGTKLDRKANRPHSAGMGSPPIQAISVITTPATA